MSKALLKSFYPLEIDAKKLQESREHNDGKIVLRGVMQRANASNQNGRIYPKKILEREIENYQKFVSERRALGEADHPDDSFVKLQNVSHLVTEIGWDGDDVVGTIELLNTPMGKLAQSLIESQVKLGISSRGLGSVKQQGDYVIVQEDFFIVAFDLVADPSTGGAFMLAENADPYKELTKSDKVDRIITDILMARKNDNK